MAIPAVWAWAANNVSSERMCPVECFEDFEQRGLVSDVTDREAVRTLLNGSGTSVYCGFDPTAD